jgi:hypothetical protein
MTDQWEFDHFGDLSWFPDEDFDGDRQDNLEEFIGGSNPADPSSLFALATVVVDGDNLVATFRRVARRSYALETSINLNDWDPQPDAVFTENGATGSLTLPTGGQSPLFARVVVTVE